MDYLGGLPLKLLFGLALALLAACQREGAAPFELNPVAAARQPENGASESFKRIPLITMTIEGYEPFAKKRTSLDVGVRALWDKGELQKCEWLSPREGTKAAERSWAPFDFYTNVTSPDEVKKEARLLGQ